MDAFPPQSQRVAPRYNEDSPASGMALAWDQEEVGAIDAQPLYLTPPVVVGIVFGCLVVRNLCSLNRHHALCVSEVLDHDSLPTS